MQYMNILDTPVLNCDICGVHGGILSNDEYQCRRFSCPDLTKASFKRMKFLKHDSTWS